jgi:putative transposase
VRPTDDIPGVSIFGRDGAVIYGRAGIHLLSWSNFLSVDASESERAVFRKHERTGRPIGDETFIERLERLLDRRLKPRKPGPKPRNK